MPHSDYSRFDLVVIGASAGGLMALRELLCELPADFSLAIAIVQHVAADASWASLLGNCCALRVKEADEKETILAGTIYVAPANYHLLVERDNTFSLTVDERVNYARPAIDVLFETAAQSHAARLIGIILTGANSDGAQGLRQIREKGGLAIVQDPQTAATPSMPQAAIRIAQPQHVLPLAGIQQLLLDIHRQKRSSQCP